MSVDPKDADEKDGEIGDLDSEPEFVDVEVVDAGPAAAPEDDGATQPAQEALADEPKAAQRFGASPGLILLAVFVALAAALFFLRPWERSKDDAAAPAADNPVEDGAAPAATETEGAASDAPPAAPAPSAEAPDASKISNAGAAAAKDAARDLPPVESTGESPDEGRGLPAPPAPDGFGNDGLQKAAKDAAAVFGAEAQVAPASGEDAIEFALDAETVPAPEVDSDTEASPQNTDDDELESIVDDEAAALDAPASDEALAALQSDAENEAQREAMGVAGEPVEVADEPPPPPPNSKIANNLNSAAAGDVEALRAMFSEETARLSDELAAERARTDRLAEELASLRARVAQAETREDDATAAEIAALREKVETIGGENRRPAAPTSSFAMVALQQRVAAGEPFVRELALLKAQAPDAPGLDGLARHAESGAPTLGALKTRFEPAIRETLAASAGDSDSGVAGAVKSRLGGLVSVRPAAPQEGTTPSAIVSRAEAELAADDVAGAVAELRALDGAAAAAIAPWLNEAQSRVDVDLALYRISAALAERGGE